ncbi:malonyl CoA-ACP transacylase [Aliidiomarina taiwanensis]|uniref:[acyl-carrier-protein] S-malonyltransferase n=1 Tax=Aliidiomarina taiwanensis TaxID=946228 RepID=A0A432X8A5_9GAMM|nr:malonyl CoA-ACP transacylase [Aliidiomarina taiwanensis]RUO43635.1 malonyl CoA-ACP transacylase [Aliidiomarina taiwanensis]
MSKAKKRAVVVCPGRGTYNRGELGYFHKHHSDKQSMLARFDAQRQQQGLATLQSLDSAKTFKSREHLQAENAAPLIYSCAYGDYLSVNQEEYEVVAVTGNSMGWYIALACAGALNADKGFELVSGMSALTQGADLGGQLIYPLVDESWQPSAANRSAIESVIETSQGSSEDTLYWSIEFGGYAVLAGSHGAIRQAMQSLPPLEGVYPLELPGHSAFHTKLMERASQHAFDTFATDFFQAPDIPLIDGHGKVWHPAGTQADALRQYTLDTQVTQTYNFTQAINVALKEFAPDVLILTGPGSTMGGAVAQVMIAQGWQGLENKADFIARQGAEPVLLAMGMDGQRQQAVKE